MWFPVLLAWVRLPACLLSWAPTLCCSLGDGPQLAGYRFNTHRFSLDSTEWLLIPRWGEGCSGITMVVEAVSLEEADWAQLLKSNQHWQGSWYPSPTPQPLHTQHPLLAGFPNNVTFHFLPSPPRTWEEEIFYPSIPDLRASVALCSSLHSTKTWRSDREATKVVWAPMSLLPPLLNLYSLSRLWLSFLKGFLVLVLLPPRKTTSCFLQNSNSPHWRDTSPGKCLPV